MKNPITVGTTINSAPEKVWKFWTTPADIIQWNNPSDDWHTLRAENDLRNGGQFLFRMEAKDGSEGFDFCGKYDEVIMNELIEYTLTDGRKTINKFKSYGSFTTITESFDPEPKTPVEVQRIFCQAVLNNFKKYVETEISKKSLPTEVSFDFGKTTDELIQLISSTSEEQFNKIPFDGSWTIAQVGDHLLKSYGVVEILNGLVTKTERSPGEKIEMIKEIFLDFSKKYQSDKSIFPADGFIDKEIVLSELRIRIAQIQDVILTKDLSGTCPSVVLPFFGELTRLEWLSLILYHTQRHIQQMKNILKSLEPENK